jgi:simple sugar transport system ATP-binding protein/ribose transport system ATP-binding protein
MPVVGSGLADAKPAAHVESRSLGKRFDAVEALADINLTIARGTIHALVGENGAGKSTLGKIISGVIRADQGEIIVNGCRARYASPHDALADGTTMISQELSLVPKLGVLENVFLGIESQRWGALRNGELRRRYESLSARSGFSLPADALVAGLRVADQKKVEILRAIARDAQLIVMDEPTAALSADETEKLLAIVRRLRDTGTTIVYVSHFLEEVLRLADMVTVLRNGRLIRTAPAAEESPESLVTAMLGRPMTMVFPPKARPAPDAPVILSVEGLTRKSHVENISLNVRAGEIVGLAGLVGSGRSEVARAIFGADRPERGIVRINGRQVPIRSPADAIRAGVVLLPESRKLQGLIMTLQVGQNVTLPHLGTLSRATVVRSRQEDQETRELLSHLDVRPPRPRVKVTSLSGGNQQKVLFAKWLFRQPRVLIADEPTSGVDVGAKQAIYDLLKSLAEQGMGVLLISSEIEEVLGLANRVYAMRQGRIMVELEGSALTEGAVTRAIFATVPTDHALKE